MFPASFYVTLHFIAGLIGIVAIGGFIATLIYRTLRYKQIFQAITIVSSIGAIGVLIGVRSPFDYRSRAPVSQSTKLYVISGDNSLYAMHVDNGSPTLLRQLPGSAYKLVYESHGMLFLSSPGINIPGSSISYNSLDAFWSTNGQDALPSLNNLNNITVYVFSTDVLYVVAIPDPAHPQSEMLYAFSLSSRAELWHIAITTTQVPRFAGVDNGAIYVVIGDRVDALRLRDGALLWQSVSLTSAQGILDVAAAAQAGGVYILIHTNSFDEPDTTVKLSEEDGKQIWSLAGVLDPEMVSGNLFYSFINRKLAAFRLTDGAQTWELPGDISEPYTYIINDGILYYPGRNLYGTCIINAMRTSDHITLWSQHSVCGYPNDLSVSNHTLYYTTSDGYLTAFNIKDGTILWTHTGHSCSGEMTHSNDTFEIVAFNSDILIVNSDHISTCQFLRIGFYPDDGKYLNVLNPLTGAIYWRYHSENITSVMLDSEDGTNKVGYWRFG
jgi:outer membrane protein assembly factor BamB